MTATIKELVQNCDLWNQRNNEQQKETLQPPDVSDLTRQTVRMDLLQKKNHQLLTVANYYSGFVEYCKLSEMTSMEVITRCKIILARQIQALIMLNMLFW